MHEWDDPNRNMGPGHDSAASDPGDDLDPRYCIRCHRVISREVSDRQGVCDDCLAALSALASGPLPGTPPPTNRPPPCPRCGSPDVEREWATDWVSKVVDVATGLASLGLSALTWQTRIGGGWSGSSSAGRSTDPVLESGPVKILRYHCRTCDQRWKAD
jgi:hypothetical protein